MTGPTTPAHQVVSLSPDQVTVLLHALACWKDELRTIHDWSSRLMNGEGGRRIERRGERRQYLWHEAGTVDYLHRLLTSCAGVTVDGSKLRT